MPTRTVPKTESVWIAVVRLSDSFRSAVTDVAAELGAEVLEWTPAAAESPPPGAAIVLLLAGGEEGPALDVVGDLAGTGTPIFLVGAAPDHRLAATAVQRGAGDYFALPDDLDLLRRSLERELREARGRREAARFAEHERRATGFETILGRSAALHRTLEQAARVAPHGDVTVLIGGETGTGKELLARSIHFSGARRDRPFVPVNCAAIPAELFESELFGSRRGAFTGAVEHRRGHFQMASSGTLLLDEIGEMPLHLQSKLLRAIEEKKVTSVGADRPVDIDVRFIATTNKDLQAEVERGTFRRDLFYRLSVMPVRVPALRERPEDIPLLARHFVEQAGRRLKKAVRGISPESLGALSRYPWPGNVRELENVIERAVIVAAGDTLADVERFLAPTGAHAPVDLSLPFRDAKARVVEEFERAYIEGLLKSHGGKLTVAAKHADMDPKNFSDKMQRYGLRRVAPSEPPSA